MVMKALMFTAPRTLEVIEVPRPEPKDGEVLLKVLASGICGSDVHGYLGTNGRRIAPMIMGHEFTARVVALGNHCKNLKIGDVVSIQPCISCLECELCVSGRGNLCGNKKVLGVLDINGAMAEFIALPEKLCFVLPDGMDYKVGSLAESFAVSFAATKKAGNLRGKNILIIGGGTIGLFALLAANLQKPALIAVSDLSETRLNLAKKMGAGSVINPVREDFDKRVAEIFGGKKAEVTIEAVGISATAIQAVSATAPGGVSVWIGNNHKMIDINMQDIVTREITVKGTYIYNHQEFNEALNLLMDLRLDDFLAKEIKLSDAPAMFAELAEDTEKYLKCIMNFAEEEEHDI